LALTKVTEDMRTLGTGEVAIGNIAGSAAGVAGTFLKQDGTWATAGTVTDTTAIEDNIALLGFKVAVAGAMAKYNLVDQTEDAFINATGIDPIASIGETRHASNYYSGGTPTPTGGTITTYVDGSTTYNVHSFTLDGTFTGASISTDYLQVAGGGGGSIAGNGGGGGGGGMLTGTATLSTVTVDVGDGGTPTNNGSNSSITGLTVSVGGAAGGWTPTVGGSGGGGSNSGSGIAGSAGTAGQGYAGGGSPGGGSPWAAGGGGGASAVGGSPGVGGAGLASSITGASVIYAGGGGGASSATGAAGGTGGGGKGGGGSGADRGGIDGTDGLGGGGGGANSGTSASGGDGIVIFRYDSALAPGMVNMTLQSNATTAETTATKGDIVMTYTNGAGTTILNTDLTAEFSANNGTNWTSMTLVDQGTTGTASPHFIVTAHNVTAGVSGTAMKYRIKTLNQTDAKATNIQAVSLGWS